MNRALSCFYKALILHFKPFLEIYLKACFPDGWLADKILLKVQNPIKCDLLMFSFLWSPEAEELQHSHWLPGE